MNGEKFVTLVVQPDNFCIRSKQDAERFLTELFAKGGEAVVKDVSHRGMHLIINRRIKDQTLVAYERDGKNIFEPDLMREGQDAVDLVYNCRKSINQRYFRKGKED